MDGFPEFPPKDLTPEQLADLLIAWEAGEVSEGRMTELTGQDRVELRGLKQDAIERGMELAERTPEELEMIREWAESRGVNTSGLNVEWPASTTTAPES